MTSKGKAGFILVLVFAIGVLLGGMVDHLIQGGLPLRARNPGFDPFRMEKGVIEHIENRLTKSYDLTEEQQAGVRKILMDSQKKYDDFFQKTRPTFDQIRRAQQDAIRALMTPEQMEKFEAWLEERRKRRGSRGDGPGREGGPRREGGPGPRSYHGPPPPESGDKPPQ